MKPVSEDKRRNIVEAKKRGETVETIIKWFNVSASTISRIWNKYLKTGGYAAMPYKGRKSDITAEKDTEIRNYIHAHNDSTLEETIEALSLNLTVSGLSRHLRKMGLSYKKRRFTRTAKSAPTSPSSGSNGKTFKRL
jgi:transposase